MPLKTGEWFVPRRSPNGNTCVEAMFTSDSVLVRNNLNPDAGTAVFTHDEWRAFISGVRDGDYDL